MDVKQTRQYEMLLRLRDFGKTHGTLFAASPVAQEAFSFLDSAINELTATDLLKLSASVSARADRKAMARKALTELLVKTSQLARVLRARGQTTPPLVLPASKSDQMLLTAGRQFSRDIVPVETEFTGHGLSSKVIGDATLALEMATSDRGLKRADHVAAITRIGDLLTAAMLDVRRLDLIVDSELANNNAIRAVWKQARRIVSRRTFRGAAADANVTTAPPPESSPAPAQAVEPEPEAEAVEQPTTTADSPRLATVIPMPLREVA